MGNFRVMLSDGIFITDNNKYVLEGYDLSDGVLELFGSGLGYSRRTFCDKYVTYGNSFMSKRMFSYTEQLYIKLIRIRRIEDIGLNRVGDSLLDEWVGVMNYAVMGLVHLFGFKDMYLSGGLVRSVSLDEFMCYYDREVFGCMSLLELKDGDYGGIWLDLRLGCITDFVLTKVHRLRFMEGSEGVGFVDNMDVYVSIYRDIFNYGLFSVCRLLSENK